MIVSVEAKEVYYLDSMGCCDQAQRGWHITCDVARLTSDALRERGKQSSLLDWKAYQKNDLKFDVPQQLNGHDCGMFMLSFARRVLDRGIDSTPMSKYKVRTQDMAHLRRVMAFEILTVGVQHAVPAPEDVGWESMLMSKLARARQGTRWTQNSRSIFLKRKIHYQRTVAYAYDRIR